MNKQYGMMVVASLVLALGVSPANAFAAGQHAGTVERKPAGKHAWEPSLPDEICVIELVHPQERDGCALHAYDPPAKLIVKGWYAPGPDAISLYVPRPGGEAVNYINHGIETGQFKGVDAIADGFIRDSDKPPLEFWGYEPVKAPATLDAQPGGTNTWEAENVYSLEELRKAKIAAVKWARAWKNYRGAKFHPSRSSQ